MCLVPGPPQPSCPAAVPQITATMAGPKGTKPSGSYKLLLSGATPAICPLATAASPAAGVTSPPARPAPALRHAPGQKDPGAAVTPAGPAGTSPALCPGRVAAGKGSGFLSPPVRFTHGFWRIMLLPRVTQKSATSVTHVNP